MKYRGYLRAARIELHSFVVRAPHEHRFHDRYDPYDNRFDYGSAEWWQNYFHEERLRTSAAAEAAGRVVYYDVCSAYPASMLERSTTKRLR